MNQVIHPHPVHPARPFITVAYIILHLSWHILHTTATVPVAVKVPAVQVHTWGSGCSPTLGTRADTHSSPWRWSHLMQALSRDVLL
ncbi:hypothetical protein PLESTM_000672100 [Pleodorina starrii]|nr:hypothetical protein PLESTM_000672100 [Pleodorina starrii]